MGLIDCSLEIDPIPTHLFAPYQGFFPCQAPVILSPDDARTASALCGASEVVMRQTAPNIVPADVSDCVSGFPSKLPSPEMWCFR